MNKYEMMFIVKSQGEEKDVKGVFSDVEKILKDNKAKLLLGVCKGKKLYDKRESAKEESIKRNIQKRNYNL